MYHRSIGDILKQLPVLAPQALSTGDVTGTAIDRLNSGNPVSSGKFFLQLGAASGTPTAISVSATVRHSDDGSTWSDYEVDGTAVTIAALTAASATGYVNVPLEGAKRYVTLKVTTALTAGSTPTILASASVVLGGASREPLS